MAVPSLSSRSVPMAMNTFETQTEQGFSSDDDNDVINLDCLFETELKSFEQGKLPEGFEVCEYPKSPSGRLVLTDGTMFVVGKLRIMCRKEDAYDPGMIGILVLPLDDPRFSALIEKQSDKKAKLGSWNPPIYGAWPGRDNALIGQEEDAQDFRSSMDEKTFVWPGGAYQWSNESYGITWLGLHGMNSICVVTKAGELDMTCVHRSFKYVKVEIALCNFRKTVISEIEDLASPSSTFIKMFGQSIPKPFGVVSLAPGSDDAHEESGSMESSDEDGEEKKNWERRKTRCFEYGGTAAAISYLERKMKLVDVEGFTVDDTIKTAISAFQYLLKKDLESHEIGVSVMVMDPGYVIIDEEKCDVRDLHAKHLEMTDIQKYLADINGPGSIEHRFRPWVC